MLTSDQFRWIREVQMHPGVAHNDAEVADVLWDTRKNDGLLRMSPMQVDDESMGEGRVRARMHTYRYVTRSFMEKLLGKDPEGSVLGPNNKLVQETEGTALEGLLIRN